MGLIQRLRALAGDARPGAWRAAGFETQERMWSGQEVRAARPEGVPAEMTALPAVAALTTLRAFT
jgi:hypothetical protein